MDEGARGHLGRRLMATAGDNDTDEEKNCTAPGRLGSSLTLGLSRGQKERSGVSGMIMEVDGASKWLSSTFTAIH
ncbi:sodium/potassium/calcium exchanger 4-like [Arapaima gigas]